MANEGWAQWRSELREPLALERRGDRPSEPARMSGYWRKVGARTEFDEPIAIWTEDGMDVIQFGFDDKAERWSAPAIINIDGRRWTSFLQWSWIKCEAVEKADWSSAIDTGRWPDGKASRRMDVAEKLGIDVEAGDNAAPVSEQIEDQINSAVDSAKKITEVKNAADARKANEMAERLNGLFNMGDAERDKQKRPHDDASKAVQAHWLPIINPAKDERTRVIRLAKDWMRAEEQRLLAEAEMDRLAKQVAIDAENKRIADENAKRIADAQEQGTIDQPDVEPELIAPLAPAAVEKPKVQATSTYGRASSLRTVKKAEITDIGKLLVSLSTHKEMVEFAQTLANRAAKAGITLDGMKIIEVRE